jgi:flagellar biosynthetic protein FliR
MLGLAAPSMAGLPGVDLQFVVDLLLHYFVASLRIGSFLIAAPLFGARWLPLQVRIVLALSITAVVAVQLPNIDTTVITSPIGVMMMLVEVGIGLSAGLVLTILFSAVMLSGEKIATAAGLGFAAQVDPQTGGQTPVVSQTLYLFLTVLFLSVDGHLVAIATLMESYDILPIGASVAPQVLIGAGINAAGMMFVAATIIMLPIAMVLLMINISIGIITKSAPQLNLFSFGFPISLLAVFILLYFSTAGFGSSMVQLIDDSLAVLQTMIMEMPGG